MVEHVLIQLAIEFSEVGHRRRVAGGSSGRVRTWILGLVSNCLRLRTLHVQNLLRDVLLLQQLLLPPHGGEGGLLLLLRAVVRSNPLLNTLLDGGLIIVHLALWRLLSHY